MVAGSLKYLDPSKVRFFRQEGSVHLRAEIEGEQCILSVTIRRSFPLSATHHFLSIQNGEGKEVGLLKELEELDPESKHLVEQDMDRRYFTPKILSVNTLKQDGGMWTFNVQTQRGPSEFYVRNWRDNSHEIGIGRWQINSVDGQRFEIANFDALDIRSKALLEQLF